MDWGLDDYWLKVAMEKAGEIYGFPMCAQTRSAPTLRPVATSSCMSARTASQSS